MSELPQSTSAADPRDFPAAMPPRRKRRWFQFGLRALMIGVTLVCVLLGLTVNYIVVPAERQRAAVQAIVKRSPRTFIIIDEFYLTQISISPGGTRVNTVEYRFAFQRQIWLAKWLQGLFPVDYFESVVRVDLDDVDEIDDSGLENLREFPRLQYLSLHRARISDLGMVHLASLRNLTVLDLSNTSVTDAGLIYLKDLKQLKHLDLDFTKVTDSGLACLCGLSQLNSLRLAGTRVTDAGLFHLSGFVQLHRLGLDSTGVTDVGLAHLRGLTQLEKLCLASTKVTDAGLPHLYGLVQLSHLALIGSEVTDAGVKALQKRLPNCSIWWEEHNIGGGSCFLDCRIPE